MKSEVFNGSRFWNYFKFDLRQMLRNHVKAAVLIGLAGLILYVIVVAWNAVFNKTWQAPSLPFRTVIFVLACTALELYQAYTYGYVTDKRKGSAWLMLPASSFEKWLSMIVITIIVIPLVFFFVYGLIDGILSLADPTYGNWLIGKVSELYSIVNSGLTEANIKYETSWSPTVLIWPLIASHCLNFLYFLLCGITFRKNKLLWAFVVLFILSLVLSFITTSISLGHVEEIESFMEAEINIRSIVNTLSAVTTGVAVLLAGGIFWRIKTLKH